MKITVPKKEILQALRTLEIAARGNHPPELVISCQLNQLVLKVGGSSTIIQGEGFFPGQTRLSGKLVQALRVILPDTDNVILEQQADRLKIGDLSYKCQWENPQVRAIQMPINAPLVQVLGIWQRYSDEEIEKSGFKTKFEAADRERRACIHKAFGYLSELGVTEEDLVRLVDDAIVRYNRANYPED